jgi:proteasome lid subunit RPN8/RPN11
MKLPAEAIQHALDQYPKESVGYLKDGVYTSLANVSETPEDTFVLSAEDVLRVHEAEADFVIHSHPKGAPYPSAADMTSQVETGIPYGIIKSLSHLYSGGNFGMAYTTAMLLYVTGIVWSATFFSLYSQGTWRGGTKGGT